MLTIAVDRAQARDQVVLRLSCEADVSTADQLNAVIAPVSAREMPAKTLVLDFAEPVFLDSSGLAVLVGTDARDISLRRRAVSR
jgi:anti-anti-sigma factor